MAMLPQIGQGFFWELVSRDKSEERAVACIFVPDSKRLFEVSFSTMDFSKEDKDALNSIPLPWIEWTGVGVRDAAKPFPLEGVTIMDKGKDRCIRPEYTNQTTLKSMLLFPDREDLVRFVGKHNAWSPHVGVVVCDESAEIMRGIYCFGHIQRVPDNKWPAFCVNKDTLKYPDGYFSENDRIVFEGLAKEIEEAAEEAAIMALKGRTPGDDSQIIPERTRQVDDDIGDYDNYGENPRAVKTNLGGPGWTKFKSDAAIKDILRRAEFIKNHRFHDIIVYKVSSNGRGFVGFTPMVGSVQIIATQHKNSDRKVRIGDTLRTRVELNKRSKDQEFVVESIVEIGISHVADFELRESASTTELILKCRDLDLRDWKVLEGEKWRGRKWGYVDHPILNRVLVPEEIAMKKEWAGNKVTCDILHYEGLENGTPQRIRLMLERVVGLFDEESFAPANVVFPSGVPDAVDSDDEYDDEEEEEDEGRGNSFQEEGEVVDRGWNDRGSAFARQEPMRSVFARNDDYNNNDGFAPNKWASDSGDERRYYTSDRGGRGNEGRDNRRGGGGGRGGSGRGGRGGAWGNQGSNSNRSSPIDPWQKEEHGFGFGAPSQQKPSMNGEGFVVIYSKNDSYIYMKNHQLVMYEGDIEKCGISLGDSASFGMEHSDEFIRFKVVHGHIKKIPHLFPTFFEPQQMIYKGELYIRVRGLLPPRKDVFECEYILDVKLDSQRHDLKLYSQQFVKKERLLEDHYYDIYVKFCSDTWAWKFECIDEEAPSWKLEEENEIDRMKKLNHEGERPSSRSSRSGDEWERVQSMRSGSSKGFGNTWRDSDKPRGSRDREDRDDRQMRSVPSRGYGPSSRDSEQQSGSRDREDRDDRPRFSKPSKAPSVVSSMASTLKTATTLTSEKEVTQLRRQLATANRMLKSVWEYKPVQQNVKMDNFFLYESIDDYVRTLAEDESEQNH